MFDPHNPLSLITAGIVCLLVLALIGFLSFRNRPFTTRELALAAVCVGTSFALSYIKLFSMPLGGSVTAASLVPVLLFAYICGFRKGLMVGIVYGWLQFAQEPFFVHPVQVMLDYVLGFACIAFAGLFRNRVKKAHMYDLLLGVTVAGIGRFLCSSLAGVLYYEVGWAGSFAYNSVLLVDIAVALAACAYLQYSRSFRRAIEFIVPSPKGADASSPREADNSPAHPLP
jgi:thiamine transporter